MVDNAAQAMKLRLRADLGAAMKGKRMDEVRLIRALIAAIDNAEAPSIDTGPAGVVGDPEARRSAEVARLQLDATAIEQVLLGEIAQREQAAEQLDGLGRADAARALRDEADLARRYLQ